MPSSHLILCCPLLLLPPIPPSIRVFSNELTLCMRWPKYWSFSFSIILSKEIPGLISFRMDWLDLLAVQGTLKNLLQHHSSKASILWPSAFFTVQLSHPYMTTWKTIALTRRTFVGKVMSLLLNMLSVYDITTVLGIFLDFSSPISFKKKKKSQVWCQEAEGLLPGMSTFSVILEMLRSPRTRQEGKELKHKKEECLKQLLWTSVNVGKGCTKTCVLKMGGSDFQWY